jgi:hypothetical protein
MATRRKVLLLLAALIMVAALALSAAAAMAGEWVQFPSTWARCGWYQDDVGNWSYWCYLQDDQTWTRVDPDWQNVAPGE